MFDNCAGNLDIAGLGEGNGSFHIVQSMHNALWYDEVEGKRQLRVATGTSTKSMSFRCKSTLIFKY